MKKEIGKGKEKEKEIGKGESGFTWVANGAVGAKKKFG